MSPVEINMAIAEACGKKYHRPTAEEIASGSYYQYEPNYYGDLNAIHEAEGFYLKHCKTVDQESLWLDMLAVVCGWEKAGNPKEALYQSHLNCVRATAAQRAEALLRTIGKWTDQPKDEDDV